MTTYIESKLNPDGKTYDHSEVIAAHQKGADLYNFYPGTNEWVKVTRASFNGKIQYRAVIEDKPRSAQPISSISSADLARHVQEKFQSGNAIPVERITLTRAEVNEVFPGLLK